MNFYPSRLPWHQDAESLYHHLYELRYLPFPNILDRLTQLFIEGTQYPEPEILEIVYRLVASEQADREFLNVLNRCCYILINHWWSRSDLRYTAGFVLIFQRKPTQLSRFPVIDRLRKLVAQFTQSPQYTALLDRVNVAQTEDEPEASNHRRSVQDELRRYPFLYPHILLNEDTSDSGQEAVLHLQRQREHHYDQCLDQYLRNALLRNHTGEFSTELQRLTGLEEPQLRFAIKHYAGKSTAAGRYRESAQKFLLAWDGATAHHQAVHHLSTYLNSSIQQFAQQAHHPHCGASVSQWLEMQLKTIASPKAFLGQSDLLLTEVSWQLLDTLLAHPKSHAEQHVRFMGLHGGLGAPFTVGLLLKLALVCRRNWQHTCDRIAKRFAALVQHYRQSFQEDLRWLLEILNYWMLAKTLHGHSPESRAGRTALEYAHLL